MAVFPLATGATTPPIYPIGSSSVDYSNIGFIPEIWSGKLIEKFYSATVLAAISNTDYEGEISKHGDRIKIRTKPTITINDYTVNGDLDFERPTGGAVELYINKGKYFATIVDDIIAKQSDLNLLSIWADDASEQMKIKIDTDVLLGILGDAATANKGANAGAISGAINLGVTGTPVATIGRSPGSGEVEVVDVLLRLGQTLDEQNVPETGRWIVLPTWVATQIKRSELRQAYLSGDTASILRNGRLGMVDRFTIYVSNLLPSGTAAGLAAGEYVIYAGHPHALTFASQMTQVETLKSERTFGEIFRGLQVYGYEVLDNTALAQAIVTKGTGA